MALASSIACTAPLRVGMPVDASAPLTGRSMPILTTFAAAAAGVEIPSVELTTTLSAAANAVAKATGRLWVEIMDSLRTNDKETPASQRPLFCQNSVSAEYAGCGSLPSAAFVMSERDCPARTFHTLSVRTGGT